MPCTLQVSFFSYHSFVFSHLDFSCTELKTFLLGAAKLGTDEAVFINIIAGQPRDHVERVALEYGMKYGKHFAELLKSETSGAIRTFLTFLCK